MLKETIYRHPRLTVKTSAFFGWMIEYLGGWCPLDEISHEELLDIQRIVRHPGFPNELRSFVRDVLYKGTHNGRATEQLCKRTERLSRRK